MQQNLLQWSFKSYYVDVSDTWLSDFHATESLLLESNGRYDSLELKV